MSEKMVKEVWKEYERGVDYKTQINLFDTVEQNENFFIGKQWEGVQSNGLPTPVFNFLKRVTLFQVASITTDNISMQATPMSNTSGIDTFNMERAATIVNAAFTHAFEENNVVTLLREYMRNAAVDGDGCLYSYWDADVETGQPAKGAIRTEIIENTRVFFGNVNDRRVQRQPYIIIARREMVDAVKKRVSESQKDLIVPDNDVKTDARYTDDKVTVLLKMWKEDGRVWAYECTKNCEVRKKWDTKLSLYPVTWLNWDYVQDCYHGMAMITGLIPNQIFVNKAFAMTMISLMSTAYPKIVYDATRIKKWDTRVGAAIGVTGGVDTVAKNVDPAPVSPQISQFIELTISTTQNFLGATSVALGDTRPDNTSAIIALQRAANVPTEITKQNLYQSVEDLGRIYVDFMQAYYGTRMVEIVENDQKMFVPWDYSQLKQIPMSLKLDVGASAYWSEIASMQTLDNLLMQGKIELVDYLERIPDGYISKKEDLIEKIKMAQAMALQQMPALPSAQPTSAPIADFNLPMEIPTGKGNSALQRSINETGIVG